MKSPVEILVLLGPNGAGKSTVGQSLSAQGVGRFLDLEGFFVARYHSLHHYRSRKADAYAAFENLVREAVGQEERPVIFEEVGLSPESIAMLERLSAEYRTIFVCLLTDVHTCLDRSAKRSLEGRFPKSPESISYVHEHFVSEVLPRYALSLVLDTAHGTVDELSQQIRQLLSSSNAASA